MAQSVLITGSSEGIGRATALYLARRGHRVIATGRSLSRLSGLEEEARAASLPLQVMELDINDDGSVAKQVPSIVGEAGGLYVLVNNAGYALWGCLEELEMDEVRAQFETNLFAVLRMSQAVLPHMRQRGRGTIINVGSISGLIGSPAGGAYAATKSALRALSAVMRLEVAQFGIRVALIEPGLIRSNFHANQVVARRALADESPYRSYEERIRKSSARFRQGGGDPMKVARRVAKIISAKRPRARYSVGVDSGLGVLAARFLPDGVVEFFVKRVVG